MSSTSKPSAYYFASMGAQFIGTPYSTMDCQAFVEAMLKEVGIKKNWSGSNAMYRDMAWVGSPEECKKKFGCIPVGAWLFIHNQDGKEPSKYKADGIGNASHVGVKTGDGLGAIHSSSSKGCVAESKFSDKTIRNGGWNAVGFCKLLDYGEKIEAILYGNQDVQEDSEPDRSDDQAPQNENTIKESEMITLAITTAKVTTSNGGTLNFRSSPKKSKLNDIGDIPNGTVLPVLEKTSDEWWQVEYDGKTGYVSAAYLTECDAVQISLDRDVAAALYSSLGEALGSVGGDG